jgi:putative PIG3 family NAD(P)H quinone oxidoreductase
MRAVLSRTPGGPETLVLEDLPDPRPGPEEVLVDVVATALNRADLLQRRGQYAGPPVLPGGVPGEVPGLELAGRVREVGARAALWQAGDAVMAIVAGGAYAEQVVVHERQLLPVPAAVPLADAAAIPEVFLTAWDALVLQGGLTSGRRALVHAGASGVGTAAIQLCGALRAPVAVTASAGKLAACRELGADLAVERSPHAWLPEVRAWAGRDGIDVVLDVVGGDELDRNVDALAVGGRIVQVGTMAGGTPPFPLGKLMGKRAAVIGTVLRARPLEEKVAVSRRFAREVLPLFDAGLLHPVVDRRFALADIAAAHAYLESNANVGKVLVDVAPA